MWVTDTISFTGTGWKPAHHYLYVTSLWKRNKVRSFEWSLNRNASCSVRMWTGAWLRWQESCVCFHCQSPSKQHLLLHHSGFETHCVLLLTNRQVRRGTVMPDALICLHDCVLSHQPPAPSWQKSLRWQGHYARVVSESFTETQVHQSGGQVMLGYAGLLGSEERRGADRSEAASFLKC